MLNILKNSELYRTDQDGSIMFKFNNNELIIETCTPQMTKCEKQKTIFY